MNNENEKRSKVCKKLVIDNNCIFQTKYEKIESFSESIFSDVYFEAYNALINIVNSQMGLKKLKVKARNFDINNIIAFVGDRGSGKTSCMRNFRRSLKEKRKDERIDFYKSFLKDKEGQNLEDTPKKGLLELRYEILTVIDPSLFSIKDSLIEIVVAQMFNRFKDKCNEKDEESFSDKQNLVKQFEKVYKDIRVLNTNKESLYNDNYDELEALVALWSAISLKDDMSNLVESYIKYMSNGKEGYLVISVDDIDMNLRVGEKMLEDIRKYLIIPNVIILMAVKMEQLKQIVQQRYLLYLKENELLEKEMDNINHDSNSEGLLQKFKLDILNKTDKYLEKVIPYNRRINIPDLDMIKEEFKIEINIDNIPVKINANLSTIKAGSTENSDFNYRIKEISELYKENISLDECIYKNLRKFIEFIIFINKKNKYLFRIQ